MLTENLLQQTMREIEETGKTRISSAANHSVALIDPASLSSAKITGKRKSRGKKPELPKVNILSSIK